VQRPSTKDTASTHS